MDLEFRPLEEREGNILERLLEHPFPGRDESRLRMSSIAGKVIDTYGSLELPVPVVHVAPVIQNVPVEAETLTRMEFLFGCCMSYGAF